MGETKSTDYIPENANEEYALLVGRLGMFTVIFSITWMLTSFDVIGVFFVSAVLFSMVFLPIILGTEEK